MTRGPLLDWPEPARRSVPTPPDDSSHSAFDGAPDAPAALSVRRALQRLQQSGPALPERRGGADVVWLQAVIDGLCELSSRDPLTGLANRRQFELTLAREIDRVARAGEPALVLMIDIDHFKRVNDGHGHPVGDIVLKAVANALSECIRPMDTVARFGGEEFALILPNCGPSYGQAVAERIRAHVGEAAIPIAFGEVVSVTVSIGGAFAPQWVRSSALLWVERADQQLYLAKSQGRNRACLEQQTVSLVSAEEKGLLFGTSQFAELQ